MRRSPRRSRVRLLTTALLVPAALCAVLATAQAPTPPGVDPAVFAAKRFPQPVRVGDLLQRTVLEPVESRRILGHVEQVIRFDDGKEAIVMRFGGFLGFGTHQIAVPLAAMVLLGSELEVLDFTPQQLAKFPVYDGAGKALDAAQIIHMGLAHPSH